MVRPPLFTMGPLTMLSCAVLLLDSMGVIARNVPRTQDTVDNRHKVLILGGGVTGVIAARTLHEQGVDDFVIIEARDELGGRMMSHNFAGITIEAGPNWIQGTQTGNGPENPILALAKKHHVQTHFNDLFGSMTTYDYNGAVDFLNVFNDSINDYTALTVLAGGRVDKKLVDTTARAGYSLAGAKPKSHHAAAAEYFQFDWEYAQTPEESSWIASSWNNNFTFDPDSGGFSPDNLLSIDQRGFKALIQEEAAEFLTSDQVLLNSTVKNVSYSTSGVTVTLTNGDSISADYALCTFSVGVLQNDDVMFHPQLPEYKQEAIQSTTMATYTKIFLHFPRNFWFETEMGLYADKERGRYPIWQSLDHTGFFPGSGIVFVTVTGDYSKRVEALPDSQVQDEVMGVLRSMFPGIQIPDPLEFYFPRWFSDPLYRGSYSNWPASFVNQHYENLRATLDERLWFAGEATSLKYFGFLHGAYFEGLDAGGYIADCIQGKQCNALGHVNDVTNTQSYGI